MSFDAFERSAAVLSSASDWTRAGYLIAKCIAIGPPAKSQLRGYASTANHGAEVNILCRHINQACYTKHFHRYAPENYHNYYHMPTPTISPDTISLMKALYIGACDSALP